MPVALNRMKFWLAAIGAVVALGVAASQPATAAASTSEYCGGWKSSWQECGGARRPLYQTYGWGDQGSVCVAVAEWTGLPCSSGAGSGVYSAKLNSNVNAIPWIKNNSSGNSFVHGIALTY
jgi:hypothetical protein